MSDWGSWLSTLVAKSEDLLTELSTGVGEFVDSVSADASHHVQNLERHYEQGTMIQGVTESVRSLLIDPAGEDDAAALSEQQDDLRSSSMGLRSESETRSVLIDRKQAALDALRRDPNTFCRELSADERHLAASLDVAARSSDIAQSLASFPELRAMHATLVPSALSDDLFWQRYLARADAIEQQDTQRKLILETNDSGDDDAIGWDVDDDLDLPSLSTDLDAAREEDAETMEIGRENDEVTRETEEIVQETEEPTNETQEIEREKHEIAREPTPQTPIHVAHAPFSPPSEEPSPIRPRRVSSELSFEVVSGSRTPVAAAAGPIDSDSEEVDADLSRLLRDAIEPGVAAKAEAKAEAKVEDDDDGWAEWE